MPVRTERMPYTEEQVERLVELYLLARETRGQDPLGSPKRAAGDEFVHTIARIRREPEARGEDPYTFYELASPLMIPDKNGVPKPMDQRKLRLYIGRRGGEGVKYPKSQEDSRYRGVENKPNLRTETHFSCKHWVDSDGNHVDVPEGEDPQELGYTEVHCERTEANTYIHRFPRKRKNGTIVHYEVDICRRHSLLTSARSQQKRKRKAAQKPGTKTRVKTGPHTKGAAK
jgi:hypothetical protein